MSKLIQDGVTLIAIERRRQMSEEGWSASHDDTHTRGSLADAAACYAAGENLPIYRGTLGGGEGFVDAPRIRHLWPWAKRWWKPSKDRVRDLVKAGALIAAEIDRLQRKQPTERTNPK